VSACFGTRDIKSPPRIKTRQDKKMMEEEEEEGEEEANYA
jgi:hypothetical protein